MMLFIQTPMKRRKREHINIKWTDNQIRELLSYMKEQRDKIEVNTYIL